MITLGIDPDVRDLAIAAWGDKGPTAGQIMHVVGRRPGQNSAARVATLMNSTDPEIRPQGIKRVAIEGQQIDKRRAKRSGLFTLAHVTGVAICWCDEWFPKAEILVPTPFEWKKGVKKHAMQARLYTQLGWGYEIVYQKGGNYAVPLAPGGGFRGFPRTQWKHLGDAILLAKWAYERDT